MVKQVEELDAQIAVLQQRKEDLLKQYEAHTELAERCKAVVAEVNDAIAQAGLDKAEFYELCGLPVVPQKKGKGKRNQPVKRYKNPVEGQPDIVCARLTKELIAYKEKHGEKGLEKLRVL
jgi:hypothetical protein